jgi:endonuclease YncB( thermonuclease family)
MNSLKRFWKSGVVGKLTTIGIGLIAVGLLCSIPVAVFRPFTPSATQTRVVANETPLAIQIILPTETLSLPTQTVEPTFTALPAEPTRAAASCIPNNPPQTGKVVDVVDGDTIKVVLDADGKAYTVRYIGMNAPEYPGEYLGSEAAVKNVALVFNKTATLIKDVSEKDEFGRLLRYVIVDNVFVNYELVLEGLAKTSSFSSDKACIATFQLAEQDASTAKLGVWNPLPTLVSSAPSTGRNLPCDCNGPALTCNDFSSHAAAQNCFTYCNAKGFGDIFRLDREGDGLACENLP